MRFTKALLNKSPDELTDEELEAIGKHFLKHPIKPVRKLHKCIRCKNLVWYDCLGEHLWECLKNPCNNLATESDKLMNNRQITHKRYCDNFDFDKDRMYYPPTKL